MGKDLEVKADNWLNGVPHSPYKGRRRERTIKFYCDLSMRERPLITYTQIIVWGHGFAVKSIRCS